MAIPHNDGTRKMIDHLTVAELKTKLQGKVSLSAVVWGKKELLLDFILSACTDKDLNELWVAANEKVAGAETEKRKRGDERVTAQRFAQRQEGAEDIERNKA